MVRIVSYNATRLVDLLANDGKQVIEAAGLSTDSKPTTFATGSLFLEVDTGDIYAFAEGNPGTWNKIVELGGGT